MRSKQVTLRVTTSMSHPLRSKLTAASLDQVQELYPLSDEQVKAFKLDSSLNLKYVLRYAERICKAFPYLAEDLRDSVSRHDRTKYSPPEYYGYVWYVSETRLQYPPPTPLVRRAQEAALYHHAQNNSHHPEYWMSREIGVEAMPDAVLAHWFADLCYSAKIDNQSMITRLRSNLENYLFSDHQIDLATKFLSCVPELCF